jgi:hypothetical protein
MADARRSVNEIEAALPFLFELGDFQEEHFFTIVSSAEDLVEALEMDLESLYGTDHSELWEAAEEAQESNGASFSEGVTIDFAWVTNTLVKLREHLAGSYDADIAADLTYQFLLGLAVITPTDTIDIQTEYMGLSTDTDWEDRD